MATLTQTQTYLTREDLFSCRIGRLNTTNYVLVSYQRSRYNSERLSIHPLMNDGITIGAIGQRIVDYDAQVCWDDDTNFKL